MQKIIRVTAAAALLGFSPVLLADSACLLETNTTFMGEALNIKDCIQNAGMPEAEFTAQCEGFSQAVVEMGGPAAKITYLAACPTPFQAKCDNSALAKTMFFYYKRSPDEAAGLQTGCEMMQGKFTKGSLE